MCPRGRGRTLPDVAPPSSPHQLRVLVVDTDHRVRHSLAGLIGCLGESVSVVGTAADLQSALQLIDTGRPQVVLVDPRLPDIDIGLALIGQIHARWPDVRVIVMGWSESLENPALASGASAFIGKTATANEFLDAIRGTWRDAA